MPIACASCDSPATIHLTKVVDGKVTEVHFCEDCAPPLLVSHNPTQELGKLIKSFEPFAPGLMLRRGDPTISCSHCGMSFAEFKQGGRFGCSHDYEAFGSQVDGLLGSIHKATTYTGKAPGGAMQVRDGVLIDAQAAARERLADAIQREDYEEAARLRDEIGRLAVAPGERSSGGASDGPKDGNDGGKCGGPSDGNGGGKGGGKGGGPNDGNGDGNGDRTADRAEDRPSGRSGDRAGDRSGDGGDADDHDSDDPDDPQGGDKGPEVGSS